MAKRKKKRSYGRRRRIGAMALNPNSMLVKYGTIAIGYLVGANFIKEQIDKMLVKITDLDKKKMYEKMIYGGLTLGGAYLQFMDKGRKTLIKTILGGIALGAGLKNALSSFGIGSIGGYGLVPALGGYGQVPAIGKRMMNGYAPQGTLSGYAPQGTLSGRNVMGSPIPSTMDAGSGMIAEGAVMG